MTNKGNIYHSSPRQLANLSPTNFAIIDKQKHLEISSKGGKNSAQKKRERREAAETFKQAATWLLKRQVNKKSQNEIVQLLQEEFPDLNNLEAMTAAVLYKAINEGDYKAYSTLRDTTGELPAQLVNVRNEEPMTININTVTTPEAAPAKTDEPACEPPNLDSVE